MSTFLLAAVLVSVVASPASQAAPAAPAQHTAPLIVDMPPPGTEQEITLSDGTQAYGRVEEVANGRVLFRTLDGALLDVDRDRIVRLVPARGRVVGGEYWRTDPNPTRLFFGPTGRSLRQGEAYLGVYEIYVPFVQVGVTDHLSLGAGTPLYFSGSGDRPFWITPKLQVLNAASTSAAIGVMHMADIDGQSVGVAYGVVTQGSRDSALTVGGGYAYARGDSRGGGPVVMLGAEQRVHKHVKLVTENYAFEGGGILTAGVRFLGERLSADLGLAAPLGVDERIVLPMVNFVWKLR